MEAASTSKRSARAMDRLSHAKRSVHGRPLRTTERAELPPT
jgi:hypothetical protein